MEINNEQLFKEVCLIRNKHPDRVPVLLKIPHNIEIKGNKKKFLVPKTMTLGELSFVIRKHIINFKSADSIFLLINGTMLPSTKALQEIYVEYKNTETNMLDITLCKESTFGSL